MTNLELYRYHNCSIGITGVSQSTKKEFYKLKQKLHQSTNYKKNISQVLKTVYEIAPR